MANSKFNSIWDALEDTEIESISMKARSEIMIALCEKVKSMKLTQAQAAKKLGITQPRLNDLLKGRINKFSLDALFELAYSAKIEVRLKLKAA